MIIVAGIARSGLTATMQMLHAGGCPCAGLWPAFEPFPVAGIPWGELQGKAVKLVDPKLHNAPAGDYKVILLSRNLKQQAKSHIKFLGAFGFPPLKISKLVKSLKKDYPPIKRWAKKHDALNLRFEDIITDPMAAALKISKWMCAPVDVCKMAACIIDRTPECYPTLLELKQIKEKL